MLANKPYNEFKLISGLKRGNHASFKKLFERYSKPIYQFSFNYLKSKEAAEDIVQEVFIKIWNNRKKLRTDSSFQSYLFTIALNVIRKHFNNLSRRNKIKHDILINFSNSIVDFDDRLDYQILLNKLDDLISKMPETRKQVFIKKKIEEKTLKEVAEEFDITTKTVEYHITKAMKFLKSEFEKL